jgi:Methyltransferase FkbM domain
MTMMHSSIHSSIHFLDHGNFSSPGLCIEPNPTYWLDLSARRCSLVGAVVGKNRMEQVSFTLAKKEFGGIIGTKFDHTSLRKGMRPRDFFTVPLLEIFQRNNVPTSIDYLSLDIEGAELYVMEAFPFDQYTIRIITIERPKKALREILEKNGYKLLRILSDFGETLWIHESASTGLDVPSMDSFDLPNQQTGRKDLEEMNYDYLKRNHLNQST